MSPAPERYGKPTAIYGAFRYASATSPNQGGEKPMVIHASLAFAGYPDKDLDSFGEKIDSHLYGVADYSNPPVLQPALRAAITDFTGKISAAAVGGPADTAAKKTSRQVLIGLLRQLAKYVETVANNNLELLLLSGFDAVQPEHQQGPLDQPVGLILKNGDTGVIIGKVKPVTNTKMYEGRISADGGVTWLPSVFTGDSRHIIFAGLTPGVEYTAQVRALGGSTGHSDWSDISKHRAL